MNFDNDYDDDDDFNPWWTYTVSTDAVFLDDFDHTQAYRRERDRDTWRERQDNHQRRQVRNQRDHRPQFNRLLQRGRNSSHLDRGNS